MSVTITVNRLVSLSIVVGLFGVMRLDLNKANLQREMIKHFIDGMHYTALDLCLVLECLDPHSKLLGVIKPLIQLKLNSIECSLDDKEVTTVIKLVQSIKTCNHITK